MQELQTQTGKNKFSLLPEATRNWLTSFVVSEHIADINSDFGFWSERSRVIPAAITRLVVGAIRPEDFASILQKNLKRSPETIENITAQIAQKILAPVADALKTTQNIDLTPIMKLVPAPSQQKQAPPQSAPTAPQPRPANLDSLAKQSQTAASTAQPAQSQPKKPMSAFASIKQGSLAHQAQSQKQEQATAPQSDILREEAPELEEPKNFKPINPGNAPSAPSSKQQVQQADRPFMLHEEAPKAPSQKQSAPISDFSFELPNQGQQSPKPQVEKTRVSFGNFFNRVAKEKQTQQPQKVESKKETPKVVHYSAFRTMLGDNDPKK